jgi:hypothetical protein
LALAPLLDLHTVGRRQHSQSNKCTDDAVLVQSIEVPTVLGIPNGVIEYIVTHAIQTAAKSGVKGLTFGAGATSQPWEGDSIAKATNAQTTPFLSRA